MKEKYALVTGASEGIGFEFCKVLASNGYNIVLVARTQQKLENAASELENSFSIKTAVIACDLASPDAAQVLFDKVTSLNIAVDILVNNAGLLFNGYFKQIALKDQENLLHCNIVALTALSHLFANEMATRGGGRILNVASTAAWMAIPNQALYAASKAFVLSFSQAFANEMKAANTGVSVTVVCPSYTATKMLDNPAQGRVMKIPAFLILAPDYVAQKAVNACLAGRPTCIPGLSNQIGMALIQMLPKMWVAKVIGRLYRRAQKLNP
ncbi:SDR family NAD(P)-dependent oxidoreductase [Alkalimarinus coralli]|uniref:SDR family NAD(P)-dependent oxidoreductase n=1 Tax=Alkalimarinus coralli TaxID=2935863 RepID=UPI00202B079C|nr:SDR family oxidoreductase [Alkalimarinus coralli]